MAWLSALFCGLLLAVSWPHETSSLQLKRTWDTFEYLLTLYAGFDAGKTIHTYFQNADTPISEGDRVTLSKMKELSQDIETAKNAVIHKISDALYSKLELNLKSIFKVAADVEFVYERYLQRITNMKNYTLRHLSNFAETLTLPEHNLFNGFERSLFRMHELLVNGDETVQSTLSIINKESSNLGLLCSGAESPQQLIEELYDLVVNTHMKGLQVRKFAFTFRQEKEKVNFQQNINDDDASFRNRVKLTYSAVEAAMNVASRSLYRCDPKIWKRGENFEQLGPVLQAHIVLVTDLEGEGSNCNKKKAKHGYGSDNSKQLEVSKRCEQGHMRDCRDFAGDYEVCYTSKSSPRLYDWAKPSGNQIYGYQNVTNCSNKTVEVKLNRLQSMFGLGHCLCTCDSGRRAEDRYFSLEEIESDYSNNKVVTGVQLVKINRVFYINIQEGTLGPNGTIIDTPQWKNVSENSLNNQWKTISELASSTSKTKVPHTHVYKDDVMKYMYNTDFHKNPIIHPITYDWSKVNLDEYNLNPNEVITGLRFNRQGSALVLEVKARTFDIKTGQLVKRLRQNNQYSYWTNSSFQGVRQEILLQDPEVPVFADSNGELDIYGSGRFLRFSTTDLHRDLSQNTVPFIDSQPIYTNPPMPLQGAGLIFKRKGKSGGFLALKINHIDLLLSGD